MGDASSGNTILGDGAVIMIIDPNGVASAMASHASSVARSPSRTAMTTDAGI